MKSKYYVGKFNDIGINSIDIPLVFKEWSHLWFISKYDDEYTLLKAYSKRSKELLKFKTKISEQQARILIRILRLTEIKSGIFRHGSTFKKVI